MKYRTGDVTHYLLIRYALPHILQIAADIFYVSVAQQDSCKVLLTDGGHAFGIGQELNLQHLSLQIIHESERAMTAIRVRVSLQP